MSFDVFLRFGFGLIAVLALILLAAQAAKRFGLAQPGGGKRRLRLVEQISIDVRHKLVIVARDGVEHLLLLGPQGGKAIETGFAPPPAPPPAGEGAAP